MLRKSADELKLYGLLGSMPSYFVTSQVYFRQNVEDSGGHGIIGQRTEMQGANISAEAKRILS